MRGRVSWRRGFYLFCRVDGDGVQGRVSGSGILGFLAVVSCESVLPCRRLYVLFGKGKRGPADGTLAMRSICGGPMVSVFGDLGA